MIKNYKSSDIGQNDGTKECIKCINKSDPIKKNLFYVPTQKRKYLTGASDHICSVIVSPSSQREVNYANCVNCKNLPYT